MVIHRPGSSCVRISRAKANCGFMVTEVCVVETAGKLAFLAGEGDNRSHYTERSKRRSKNSQVPLGHEVRNAHIALSFIDDR
jgi:hypothetical protein